MALVLASTTILGSTVERTFTKVTRSASELSLHGASDAVGSSSSVVERQETSKPFWLRLVVFAMMCVAALIAVGTGWTMLNRSDRAAGGEKPEIPSRRAPIKENVLLTRLNVKKELLWKQLLADHDLLLKNRIEVRHVMTRDPISIRPSTSGQEMAKLFSRHDIAHLLVRDNEGRFLGAVKEIDHQANPEQRAESLLKPWPVSVESHTTLGAAISKLMEQDSSLLPVVDNDKLCGLLTPTDLVLTLHCSLQLWVRIALTMESNTSNVEQLESANNSIDEAACDLKQRVRRLPDQIKSTLKSGDARSLVADINEMSSSLEQLMSRLEVVQSQIRQQSSQLADLKDPAPDAATGAASREELDRILRRLSESSGASRQKFSLILFVAADYQRLLEDEGRESADEYMRLTVRAISRTLQAQDHIARYREDTFAIVLPGADSGEAQNLCRRLTAIVLEDQSPNPMSRPTLNLVSPRAKESLHDLLQRAEAGCPRPATAKLDYLAGSTNWE
ncbi:CBS domain-containing protein [Lignipirellula cremea]|uniref:CBS domain-containing protein n=1 Tax=Lignipirellula cremea TaxID=2528010 RepID=UPI0018D24EC5|nr:CBS domain-containing protein [Lignipirellula cremea]